MHTPFCDCTEAAAVRQSPFKYVECFQLQRASELPKWDFRRWASLACVCTMGGIKARSTVLISDTDYDLGFYERLLSDAVSVAGDVCCIQDSVFNAQQFFLCQISRKTPPPHFHLSDT